MPFGRFSWAATFMAIFMGSGVGFLIANSTWEQVRGQVGMLAGFGIFIWWLKNFCKDRNQGS